jgi:hypothetical protein
MKLNDYEIEEQFKEMINECYPVVTLFGMESDPATVLKKIDPIAYRVMLSDYEGTEGCSNCGNVLVGCECEE